jgi:hypothetical protein
MDIELIETGNGGDIIKKAKDLSIIFGFENMPYLALFGGNVKASTPSKRLPNEQNYDWWGNGLFFPNNQSVQFNSVTERTLNEVALTSSGRLEIEQAVLKDLEFMRDFAIVSASVSIMDTNRVQINVRIQQPDNLQAKEFIYIWDATQQGLTEEENNSDNTLSDQEGFDYEFDFELA